MKKMQRKKRLFYVLTAFLLYVFPSFAQQLDNAPVVSIDANIGVLFLSPMKGSAGDITGWQSLNTDNTSGMHTKYRVEYYLPRTRFSVKGGYEEETLTFIGGDLQTHLQEISLGGRYYPLKRTYAVQPYAGLDTYYHIGAHRSQSAMSAESALHTMDYERKGTFKHPFFSVAPVVGLDVYLFGSVALELEYGYRFALGSRLDIAPRYRSSQRFQESTGHLHRGALSVGVKVSFPFSFAATDTQNIFTLISDLLFPEK